MSDIISDISALVGEAKQALEDCKKQRLSEGRDWWACLKDGYNLIKLTKTLISDVK